MSYRERSCANSLKEMTYREMRGISEHLAMCANDAEEPVTPEDIALWLLSWADAIVEEGKDE